MPTYYQILQVDPAASPAVIEAAYRRLARSHHPDLSRAPDAGRQMQVINEAYACLRDPAKRRAYDSALRIGATSPPPPAPAAPETLAPGAYRTAWAAAPPAQAQLSYQARVGREFVISIGRSADFEAVLHELKRRVPADARRYYPNLKQWRIAADYEPVLRELFANFSPDSPARTGEAPAANAPAATRPAHRPAGAPWGLLVVLALLGGIWYFAAQPRPPETAPAAVSAPAPSRRAAEVRTGAGTGAGEGAVAQVTQTANLRRGPGVDYPVLQVAARGESLRLAGYNDQSGEVWYLLEPQGWIWRGLVAPQPVDLPWAPAPAPDAAPARSEDLAAAQDAAGSCTGGCVAEPPGCDPPIKGNVSVDSGARIYHVYGQEYYDETIINPRYGERWFCTEQEARDAGWRKAYR